MNSIFLWIVAILLVVGLFGLWACMIQVIRQQGRILLRLDELDKTQNPDAPQGLPPGSAMTAFELEDMEGRSFWSTGPLPVDFAAFSPKKFKNSSNLSGRQTSRFC